MLKDLHIPEPILFSPLKHYLPFIRGFINITAETEVFPGSEEFIKELRHIGNCVMDIYMGNLQMDEIFKEVMNFLASGNLDSRELYKRWAGTNFGNYRIITLTDGSRWTMKYYDNEARYVHMFPARLSPYTFRIKANTLKSAILYQVLIGKDYIAVDDLNKARRLAGLSPIRDIADVEAITGMIERLRD